MSSIGQLQDALYEALERAGRDGLALATRDIGEVVRVVVDVVLASGHWATASAHEVGGIVRDSERGIITLSLRPGCLPDAEATILYQIPDRRRRAL